MVTAREEVQRSGELVSFKTIAALIKKRWRVISIWGAVVAVLAGVVTLVLARRYSATTSFIVQIRTPQSSLSNVAEQFGFALASVDPTQSPAFYVELLRSRTVRHAVANGSYGGPPDTILKRRGDLATVLDVDEHSAAARQEAALKWLGAHLKAEVDQKTNIVTMHLTAPSPDLAQQLLHNALAALNTFNLEQRQSQASAERRFVGERLAASKTDLQAAEDRLLAFRERNRSIDIPRLQLEQDRLNQQVTLLQQVYSTLAQNYEQAKIDEVRNTPVINIIDPPERPFRPDGRGVVLTTLLGFLAGALCYILFAFVTGIIQDE